MTHPLKKVSVVDLQTAFAEAVEKLTDRKCSIEIREIDFQEPAGDRAVLSMQFKFVLDLKDCETPF
ncbi:hypothetical protein LSO07_08600 [Janthinobacterium sp. PLB04]|uniref:Uncharacterized protein n=1 Tax=Janthinobacterium lividum TaxID=29581 RepID=A0AAJ4T6V9_9BURK|nr:MULTISPECIES: hypothetical protein [Janthinobacterium]KAB0331754.1 hypothetical protein F3B38_08680 [Janthinobacterium lividum]QSX97953.1 hypothetical protein J3P46_08590 [Janthinobacterium lividum]UGQ37923.1 hypothetical protein LSO07_08600 [Janthinobacterium sp. PLB04]